MLYSAVPSGYYSLTDGKSGKDLKSMLCSAIKGHTVLTYTELWSAFRTTDARPDGTVWDVYSNTTQYEFGVDQDTGVGGNSEGQYYNREHSFPNSWWGKNTNLPMYTDLFHLYPADKWVNARRGNRPFGSVKADSFYSANHFSKWGTSTESGSTLNVFEPADEMKGDFARTYFYMVTRYEELVSGWKIYADTEMLSGDSYPALSSWAVKLLLAWHKLDPVSEKELKRNEVIFRDFQHNRNPFIDVPQLVDYVWGDSTAYAFHPSRYLTNTGVPSPLEQVAFSAWASNDRLYVSAPVGTFVRVYDVLGSLVAEKRQESPIEFFYIKGNRLLVVSSGANRMKLKM